MLIIILFANGRGWYNLINFASLAAFVLAHFGLFYRNHALLYPIFAVDVSASAGLSSEECGKDGRGVEMDSKK